MVRLYTLSTDTLRPADMELIRAKLPARYERACRMRSERGRSLSLAAGLLLLRDLGIPDESVLYEEPDGKPAAKGFPPFSLSHSGRYAVLAVRTDAGSPVGVDLEEIRPFPTGRMQKLLLPEEYAWVTEKRPEEKNPSAAADGSCGDFPVPGDSFEKRFFTLWTLKESVCKACGLGLKLDPRRLNVLPLLEGKPVTADGAEWTAQTTCMEEYVISTAYCNNP